MSRRGKRRKLVLAALPVLALVRAASAQDAGGGPTVFGARQQQRRYIVIENLRGNLEFKWRFLHDRIESEDLGGGTTTSDSKDNHFEETVTLGGTGYIYHPNLVDLVWSGTFGLQQEQFDINGDKNSADGTLYAYDASATILRKELAPITLYARRNDEFVSRSFGPTLENIYSAYGGVLDVRSQKYPARLEIFHTEQELTGLEAADNYTLNQTGALLHSEYVPSQHQRFTFDYNFTAVDQTQGTGGTGIAPGGPTGTDTYNINDTTLSHYIEWGPKTRYSLSSSINYFDQGGELALSRLHWDELLRLKHTDSFETRWEYWLDQQKFQTVDQVQQQASAAFTHRLYQSLVTNGRVGFSNLDSSEGYDTQDTFGNLDFDYRKKVPLGVLSATLNLGYDVQENSAVSTFAQVVNQTETFNDGLPITIIGNNIDPRSVVVTDPSGLRIFTRGTDYTVQSFPGFIQLTRQLGGAIPPASTVLVDYNLGAAPSNTTTTGYYNIGGRYDIQQGPFRGLAFYGHYGRQTQSIDSTDTTNLIPNEYTDWLAGTEYSIWELRFSAERQIHDSTIQPYDASRFTGIWQHAAGVDSRLQLAVAYTIINYTDENNEIDLLTASITYDRQLSRDWHLSATVLWHDERNDLQGPLTGLDEQLQLRWQRRQTSLYATLRNATLDSDQENSTFQYVEIGLRRDF